MSNDTDILGLDDETVAQATVSGGRNYLRAGVHLLEISSIKAKLTRKNAKVVIWEFNTLESTTHKPGEIITRFIDVDPEKGLGEFKSAIAAVFGVSFEEVEVRHLRMSYSDNQPLVGKKLRCSAQDGNTKGGNTFTYCTWTNAEVKKAPSPAPMQAKKSALDEALA